MPNLKVPGLGVRAMGHAVYADGVVESLIDTDEAYMEFDAGSGYARFGAKGTGNRGVKVRTLNLGAAVDAVSYAPDGTPTFVKAPNAPGIALSGSIAPTVVDGSIANINMGSGTKKPIANNGTFDLTISTGSVIITDGSGKTAMFMCSASAVTEMADPGNVFSTSSGTAGTNVFWNAGTGAFRIENKTGGLVNYTIWPIQAF